MSSVISCGVCFNRQIFWQTNLSIQACHTRRKNPDDQEPPLPLDHFPTESDVPKPYGRIRIIAFGNASSLKGLCLTLMLKGMTCLNKRPWDSQMVSAFLNRDFER